MHTRIYIDVAAEEFALVDHVAVETAKANESTIYSVLQKIKNSAGWSADNYDSTTLASVLNTFNYDTIVHLKTKIDDLVTIIEDLITLNGNAVMVQEVPNSWLSNNTEGGYKIIDGVNKKAVVFELATDAAYFRLHAANENTNATL